MSKVKIQVAGRKSFTVKKGTRLVNALEANGVDVLHRCGGNARCTTCKVQFLAGEPKQMTAAEKAKGLADARLSCQITCEHDMVLRANSTLTSSGLGDAGPATADHITPDPVWV
jgi:ferredoxin